MVLSRYAIRSLIHAGQMMGKVHEINHAIAAGTVSHPSAHGMAGHIRGRATRLVLEAADILEGLEARDGRRIADLESDLATLEKAVQGCNPVHSKPGRACIRRHGGKA